MLLVVDTSVAVKWVVAEGGYAERGAAAALDLLTRGLVAPDSIIGEFAAAMVKKIKRREIDVEQARQAIPFLGDVVQLVAMDALVDHALELAVALSHPFHDCAYLALALKINSSLVTADEKFVSRCRAHDPSLPVYLLYDADWV